MSRYPQLYLWTQEIATRLPTLNRALATVLALWTIGRILARAAAWINGSALPHGVLPPQSWPEPSPIPPMTERRIPVTLQPIGARFPSLPNVKPESPY